MSLSYSEKLKDPRWQKKRLKIFERDNWMCTKCDQDRETLHIHHKLYILGKDPWEYKDEDLCTLCETCHRLEKNHPAEILTALLKKRLKESKTNNG